MKRLVFLFVLLTTAFLFSCSSDDADQSIDDYLKANNLTAQKTEDGLYYIIDVPGNDTKPKVNSTVRVKYEGKLLNGDVFDKSDDFKTSLSNVIAGWRRGMVLFGEGGKGTLIIPPSLGYGSQAVGAIPANSVLIFDVELLEVF